MAQVVRHACMVPCQPRSHWLWYLGPVLSRGTQVCVPDDVFWVSDTSAFRCTRRRGNQFECSTRKAVRCAGDISGTGGTREGSSSELGIANPSPGSGARVLPQAGAVKKAAHLLAVRPDSDPDSALWR